MEERICWLRENEGRLVSFTLLSPRLSPRHLQARSQVREVCVRSVLPLEELPATRRDGLREVEEMGQMSNFQGDVILNWG